MLDDGGPGQILGVYINDYGGNNVVNVGEIPMPTYERDECACASPSRTTTLTRVAACSCRVSQSLGSEARIDRGLRCEYQSDRLVRVSYGVGRCVSAVVSLERDTHNTFTHSGRFAKAW